MTSTSDTGFVAHPVPARRSPAAAPISAWPRAVMGFLFLYLALNAWFVVGTTPMPTEFDIKSYAARFADLDRQVAKLRQTGADPLVVVFLGTSRLRNVTLDSAGIAEAASRTGIERPVASTVLGINWGGFERLEPALPLIESRRPDVIVVMPELLTEDFTYSARMRFGLIWLRSVIAYTEYRAFAPDELFAPSCEDFAGGPVRRFTDGGRLIGPATESHGPVRARAFLKHMAEAGTKVIITEVPVTNELAALRPAGSRAEDMLEHAGLAGTPGVDVVPLSGHVPRSAYCDYAHIDPKQAASWQDPFFQAAAGAFNQPRIATALR